MKNKNSEIELMKILDGEAYEGETSNEAAELKQIVAQLKELPQDEVSSATDRRFLELTKGLSSESGSSFKNRRYIRYKTLIPIAAAACLAIVLFTLRGSNHFEADYKQLASNTDKISFIYALNDKSLSTADVAWLYEALGQEKNPNIKVTIIDVLDSYKEQLNGRFLEQLQTAKVPAVQMAMLNVLETLEAPGKADPLMAFSRDNDLEATVLRKVQDIISKSE